MTDKSLANWIISVCRDVGKNKGIEFHPPAPRGAQVRKRWEVSCRRDLIDLWPPGSI
jgi:hypothetical protein